MNFSCEETIFGGYFNLVLNIEKDKRGGKQTTNARSREKVSSLMQNMDLIDVWRESLPDVNRYTWRQRQPDIHCRLDFFLISSHLSGNVLRADILPNLPGFRTDHSLITLHFKLNQPKRTRLLEIKYVFVVGF